MVPLCAVCCNNNNNNDDDGNNSIDEYDYSILLSTFFLSVMNQSSFQVSSTEWSSPGLCY